MAHREHYINGVRVPSVTEIFNPVMELVETESGLNRWYGTVGWEKCQKIFNDAGVIGTEIHDAIEHSLITSEENQKYEKHVQCVRSWMQEKKFNILKEEFSSKLLLEVELRNTVDMYGGTCDAIGRFEDSPGLWLVDWKTSSRIHDTYPLQLAGYAAAAKQTLGLTINNGLIFRMDKKPTKKKWWEVRKYNNLLTDYYPLFLDMRRIWGYINNGELDIPR